MWYNDIADLDDAAATAEVAEFYDVCPDYAALVVTRCRTAFANGEGGYPAPAPPAECDCAQCELVQDAYKEGLTVKDRLVVHLSSETDGCCNDCGSCVAYHEGVCSKCESDKIIRMVMVTVTGPGAEEWADNDQTIDGSSWETDGSDLAYTILTDRKDLVADLTKEGYKLDLSDYEGPAA